MNVIGSIIIIAIVVLLSLIMGRNNLACDAAR